MPANSSVDWKCVKRSETDPNTQLEWQSGSNNQLQTGGEGSDNVTSGSF